MTFKSLVGAAVCVALMAAAVSVVFASDPISHPDSNDHIEWDSHKFMRVSEVRPGMKGYALTVFKGTKIEKFDIEILGVIAKFNMGKDYILFRALDGPSITRGLNIAHGMSGSPIYVNGRLLGAISMGIPGVTGAPSFPKEPIALATPIEEMFDAWRPDLPKNPLPISASPDVESGGGDASGAGRFTQLDLPLSVSGMTPRGMSHLNEILSPYHFDLIAGGGGYSVANDPLAQNPTLEPGSAVGVALAQGDVDITATGTVTYREGNRLLLFGHPLADLGPIDAALTTAYVVDVYPSYQDSIKLGAPIKTVGRIFQDRPFSVGAVIGDMPHMIPVTITVDDIPLKQHRVFHSSVIDHPLLASRLIEMVADEAILDVHGEPGDSMATVKMDVDADEVGHIVRTNTFFDSQSIDQAALGDLQTILSTLTSNPFYPLGVKSVSLAVTIENRHDTAEIDHIFLKQSNFQPGDTVHVGVVMKPFKQPMRVHMIDIKIPQSAPNGQIDLSVKGGAADAGGGVISIGGLVLIRPSSEPGSTATNVAQLVKEFNERALNNQIVVRLLLPTRAISVQGQKLSDLPPNIVSAMQSNRTSGLKTERDEVKVMEPSHYIVSGSQTLSITVEKKEDVGPSTPSAPAPPPAPTQAPASADGDNSSASTRLGAAAASSRRLVAVDSVPDTSERYLAIADNAMQPRRRWAHVTLAGYEDSPGATITKPQVGTPGPSTPKAPSAAPAPTPVMPPVAAAPPIAPVAAPSTESHPVGRSASVWEQSSSADFTAGTLTNTTVSSDGGVVLSRPMSKVAETGATYAWSLAAGPNGSLYIGTGDGGIIYKLSVDGKLSTFCKTGELEVTALATDSIGNVYAGTIPNGIVFRISPGGTASAWFTATEKYITALAFDAANNRMFVGTGGGTGKVYVLSMAADHPDAKTWLLTSDEHILAMAVDSSGVLYSGTAPNGWVYRTDLNDQSHVFYEGTQPNITGLAIGKSGDIYVGSSPKGYVVRVGTSGVPTTIYDRGTDPITTIQRVGDDVYAVIGNSILRFEPGDNYETFVAPNDEQFVSLGGSADGSVVYVGTNTAASIYEIGGLASTMSSAHSSNAAASSGQFDSSLLDANGPAHWGTITWRAETPDGTHVTLMTRSGEVAPPDKSWSDWSPVYHTPTGEQVVSPPTRFLQYRAILTADKPGASALPRLAAVTVYYMPRNEPPTVRIISPKEGDTVSKSLTIQWNAVNPEHDTLTYDVSVSSDNGATWTLIKKRWRPAPPSAPAVAPAPSAAPAAGTKRPPPPPPPTDAQVAQQVDQMKAQLDNVSQLPPAVRAQIMAQAPNVIRQTGIVVAPATAPAGKDAGATNLKETSFTWDTSEVQDGSYRIQVRASDRVSDPIDPQSGKDISGVFVVANKPPLLTTGQNSVNEDMSVTVHGVASSSTVFVKAVQYQVDGGDPAAASADDGIFDSPNEAFTVNTPTLTAGDHSIEITAFDWAGNTASTTVKVTVK